MSSIVGDGKPARSRKSTSSCEEHPQWRQAMRSRGKSQHHSAKQQEHNSGHPEWHSEPATKLSKTPPMLPSTRERQVGNNQGDFAIVWVSKALPREHPRRSPSGFAGSISVDQRQRDCLAAESIWRAWHLAARGPATESSGDPPGDPQGNPSEFGRGHSKASLQSLRLMTLCHDSLRY